MIDEKVLAKVFRAAASAANPDNMAQMQAQTLRGSSQGQYLMSPAIDISTLESQRMASRIFSSIAEVFETISEGN